jgi:hypothetical protein
VSLSLTYIGVFGHCMPAASSSASRGKVVANSVQAGSRF